jgi:hypothetical protein
LMGTVFADTPIEKISVAISTDSVPLYFVDETGRPPGWLVDIWRLWSSETRIRVAFVSGSFGESLEMARAIIWSNPSIPNGFWPGSDDFSPRPDNRHLEKTL